MSQINSKFDEFVPGVGQQMRQDLGLETTLNIDIDDSVGGTFMYFVQRLFTQDFVTITIKGLPKDGWDSWSESRLKTLKGGWLSKGNPSHPSLLVYGNALETVFSNSRDSTHDQLDECKRAVLGTLQSDIGIDSVRCNVSDHVPRPIDEEGVQEETPFEFLDVDGKPRTRRVVQVQKKRPNKTRATPSSNSQQRTVLTGEAAVLASENAKTKPSKNSQRTTSTRPSKVVLLSEKAEAAPSGGNKRKREKLEQLCDRCGRSLEMAKDSVAAHIKLCYGKCTNCHDQDIACHRKAGQPCRGCVEKKLEYEGASHGHLG